MPSKDPQKQKEARDKWRRSHPEMRYVASARNRARKLGLDFNLTTEDIVIPDVCPVLQIPLHFTEGSITINTPSIDRVDNSKGYVKGNIRMISTKANFMKSDMTIQQCERLLAYMKGEI